MRQISNVTIFTCPDETIHIPIMPSQGMRHWYWNTGSPWKDNSWQPIHTYVKSVHHDKGCKSDIGNTHYGGNML